MANQEESSEIDDQLVTNEIDTAEVEKSSNWYADDLELGELEASCSTALADLHLAENTVQNILAEEDATAAPTELEDLVETKRNFCVTNERLIFHLEVKFPERATYHEVQRRKFLVMFKQIGQKLSTMIEPSRFPKGKHFSFAKVKTSQLFLEIHMTGLNSKLLCHLSTIIRRCIL